MERIEQARREVPCFNGARSIDRDERRVVYRLDAAVVRAASMGPGRLTGMNDLVAATVAESVTDASMGPGRLTGMNAAPRSQPAPVVRRASMGPGRLTGMNAPAADFAAASALRFNGARSIDRDERYQGGYPGIS